VTENLKKFWVLDQSKQGLKLITVLPKQKKERERGKNKKSKKKGKRKSPSALLFSMLYLLNQYFLLRENVYLYIRKHANHFANSM